MASNNGLNAASASKSSADRHYIQKYSVYDSF